MLNAAVNDGLRTKPLLFSPMETMGDRIKMLREAKGLSQAGLAAELDLTRATVHQWENGNTKDIKLANFLRLVEFLGTDPAYLIWGPERRPPERASTGATGRFRRPKL